MTESAQDSVRQIMDSEFEQIRRMSLEIQSLIRQGVRQGIDDKLKQRDQLLRDWFGKVSELITVTQEQEAFLQQLLTDEKALVRSLESQQQQLAGQQKKHSNVKQYRDMGRH